MSQLDMKRKASQKSSQEEIQSVISLDKMNEDSEESEAIAVLNSDMKKNPSQG